MILSQVAEYANRCKDSKNVAKTGDLFFQRKYRKKATD